MEEREKERKNREQSYFLLVLVHVQCRTFPKRTLRNGSELSFYFISHLTTKFSRRKFHRNQPDIDGQWEVYHVLKGHCHGDFAVLGQFCAEIITLKLYS